MKWFAAYDTFWKKKTNNPKTQQRTAIGQEK